MKFERAGIKHLPLEYGAWDGLSLRHPSAGAFLSTTQQKKRPPTQAAFRFRKQCPEREIFPNPLQLSKLTP
jgi:hypothetical protein